MISKRSHQRKFFRRKNGVFNLGSRLMYGIRSFTWKKEPARLQVYAWCLSFLFSSLSLSRLCIPRLHNAPSNCVVVGRWRDATLPDLFFNQIRIVEENYRSVGSTVLFLLEIIVSF